MQKTMYSKTMAFIMILALVLSMTCMSFAANNDPNMTSYGSSPWTTTVTQGTGTTTPVTLQAGPADASWAFTGFNNKLGADNVTWSVVSGSISGVTLSTPTSVNLGGGKWITEANVSVSSSAPAGSASVMVVNNATGANMNFTIVVNPTTPVTTTANADFEIYSAASTTSAISTGSAVVAKSTTSSKNFLTVADAMNPMKTAGIIAAYDNSAGYVTSMTVGTTAIAPSYPDGWQYRIYRNMDSDPAYEMVDITKYLGYDDVLLQDGDIVQWKVGSYDDNSLFAPEITR